MGESMIESLARLGYASKAFIYAIVGGLAAAAALNQGGRVTDTSGALRVILEQPFGSFLLILLAVGLCGYAAWRVLDAVRDPEHKGTDTAGLLKRGGSMIRGLIYGGLGLEAFRLVRGRAGASGGEAELWTARIMDLPFGPWLVGIAGAAIAAYGVHEVIGAIRHRLDKDLDLSPLPRSIRSAATRVSRLGVGARGVIAAVLGGFLVRAALQRDPSEAHGTREAVLEIANTFQGRWLLAAIAAGLIAYGIDQAIHARCRRIRAVT
jgi:hypothetical protein